MGPPGVRVQPAQLPEKTPAPRKDRDAVGLARASPGWRGGGGCPCPARGCGEELGASTSVLSDPPMHLHHAPAPAQCRHLPYHLQAFSLPPAATWELCFLPAEQTPSWALVGVRVTKDGRRASTAPPLPGAIVPAGWGRRRFRLQAYFQRQCRTRPGKHPSQRTAPLFTDSIQFQRAKGPT